MSNRSKAVGTVALLALLSISPHRGMADQSPSSFRLAMMEMMPMAPVAAVPMPVAPMPAAPMLQSQMRRGEMPVGQMPTGQMPPGQIPMGQMAPGQMPPSQTPPGQMAQPAPMPMCPMCAMMGDMMRMGAAQPAMPPMQGGAGMPAMGSSAPAASMTAGSSAARLEGRIAFLRTELRISAAQTAAWDIFASSLRSGREHLDAARTALQDSTTNPDPMARLQSFEAHLTARTEAIRQTRLAFNALHGQLDDAQKSVATTMMLPFIGAF